MKKWLFLTIERKIIHLVNRRNEKMTVFNSSNISEFENQQFVGLEGEVVTLKELCSKANLRMLFDHSEVLKPYTLTLIDDDWVSCANVVFRRRNYENATRDVLKYVNDKLNNNS